VGNANGVFQADVVRVFSIACLFRPLCELLARLQDDTLKVVVHGKLATGWPLRKLKALAQAESQSELVQRLVVSNRLKSLRGVVTKIIIMHGYYRATVGYF
jgi:hypothetical protein